MDAAGGCRIDRRDLLGPRTSGLAARFRNARGQGRNGTALTLDGATRYAESSLPIVDTTRSFTVSAWAKPEQSAIGDLVAQTGTYQDGFDLGMQSAGHAVLKWPTTDTADGGGVR
jgi:hypothetical protein